MRLGNESLPGAVVSGRDKTGGADDWWKSNAISGYADRNNHVARLYETDRVGTSRFCLCLYQKHKRSAKTERCIREQDKIYVILNVRLVMGYI